MVDNQIRPNNIKNNKILDLFNIIEKEKYIPEDYKEYAYFDNEIKFRNNRSYLSNLHIAQMLEAANLKLSENVLHIGALTGYVTTILSNLAKSVVAIEYEDELFKILKNNVERFSLNNVIAVNNNYEDGYEKNKPYDVIFIDCVTEFIPEIIFSQLKDSNGRILLIEKIDPNLQNGVIITKNNNSFLKECIFDSLSKSSSIFKLKKTFQF